MRLPLWWARFLRSLLLLLLISCWPVAAAFEACTVRPSLSRSADSIVHALPGGRVAGENVTLRTLIQVAYQVSAVQVVGGPGWLDADRFDVSAVTEARRERTLREMAGDLRQLLAERFGLRAGDELRPLPVLALEASAAGVRPGLGTGTGELRMTRHSLDGSGVPVAALARGLSTVTGELYVDRSGFAGLLDVHLLWGVDDDSPALSTLLQESLGLAVRRARLPVPVVVVRSVSRLRPE